MYTVFQFGLVFVCFEADCFNDVELFFIAIFGLNWGVESGHGDDDHDSSDPIERSFE